MQPPEPISSIPAHNHPHVMDDVVELEIPWWLIVAVVLAAIAFLVVSDRLISKGKQNAQVTAQEK